MGMIVDLIIVVVLIALTVAGYKKGLIKSVMGLVAVIASIVVAVNFYSYPAHYIKENFVQPYFVDTTSDIFSSLMNGGTETISPDKIFEDQPDALSDIAKKFGLDIDLIKDFYEDNIKHVFDSISVEEAADRFSDFVTENAVETISNVLAFIITFLASLMVISLLLMLINLIFRLPMLNFTNRLAGAIFGLVKGALICIVILNVLAALTTATTDIENGIFNYSQLKSSNAFNLASSYNMIFIGK